MSLAIRHSRHEEGGSSCPADWSARAGPAPQQLRPTNPCRALPLGGRQSRGHYVRASETHDIRPDRLKCGVSRLKADDCIRRGYYESKHHEDCRLAVTSARHASLHGLPVGPVPSRPRPFHSTNRALVTSGHSPEAAGAAGFRLWLGGGTLCSGCVSLGAALRPSLHFPRSPTTDRSWVSTEQLIRQSAIGEFRFSNQ